MGMLAELLGYASTGVGLLISLVVLVLGVALVRPVSATAGYAIAAAGGIRLLFTCCTESLYVLTSQGILPPEAGEGAGWVGTLLTPIHHLVFWGLIAFAAYTVAQEKARAAAPGQGS
jgi:hypothetical protein